MENIRVYYRIIAWDKAGKVIHRSGRRRSHSFLKQFAQLLLVGMQQAAVTIKDIGAVDRSQGPVAALFSATGPINRGDIGIVLGTDGTDGTAEDITDFTMAAIINHGTAPGEMLFQLQTFDADVTVSGPDASFSFTRNYNNNSGAAITVREVGVRFVPSFGYQALRDTPTEIVVPDGGGCQVTYTIQVSVL